MPCAPSLPVAVVLARTLPFRFPFGAVCAHVPVHLRVCVCVSVRVFL